MDEQQMQKTQEIVALILQAVTAALAAAPQAIELSAKTREWLASLNKEGVIPAELQDRVSNHVDAICDAIIKGEEAPAWSVEPDPQ